MRTELLLGDEAVARGAIDAGIAGAFSYPGTPSTEIFEAIEEAVRGGAAVSALWSTNEKVAYEEALGMSYAGRRALVSMKHVGLNVAADPFVSSALTGVCGGLVLAVADDPGMHSSQNEQDSRFYSELAQIPLFEPSDQQSAYDLTREAFEYSEATRLPVMLRLVTRLAHSRANVTPRDPAELPEAGLASQRDPNAWTLVPAHARRRYAALVEQQGTLLADSEAASAGDLTLAGPRGVIAAGIGINYVRETNGQAPDLSRLDITRYPLPVSLIRRLVEHCEDILVVEDGYPFIERRLTGLLGLHGRAVRGKLDGTLPPSGELTPDLVAAALGAPAPDAIAPDPLLAARPPQLCRGCPHADSFKALVEATGAYRDAMLFSDIGCYTLGVMPPYRAVHSCVDMGASIGMASGAARAGAWPVLCTIGDSTFAHSGMTPLVAAAHHDVDITVLILDNAAVAMTGIQESLLCGEGLDKALLGLGVPAEHLHVIEPVAKAHADNVALIRREVEHHGLSVIVCRRPCIHLNRKLKSMARASAAAPEVMA